MKKLLNFFAKNKELSVIIFFVLLMIVVAIIQFNQSNKQPDTRYEASFKVDPGKENQVSWQEVAPGETTYTNAKSKFTGFQQRDIENDLVVYKHVDYENPENFYRYTNVATDSNDVIKYIDFEIHPFKKLNLPIYESKFGLREPDIKIPIDNKDIIAYTAYAYLDKGLMLYVNDSTQSVSHEVYFEPTTKQEFEAFWIDKLIVEDWHGPF